MINAGPAKPIKPRSDTIPLNKLIDAHLKKNGLIMPYATVVKMRKERDAKNYLTYAQQNSDSYGVCSIKRHGI